MWYNKLVRCQKRYYMKKTGNFILSLIMPRKMAKFRNMHGLLAFLIYFIGMFMAIGFQFIMSEEFVKKELPRYEYRDTLETVDNLPIATGLRFANMQSIIFSTDSDQAIDEEKGSAQITKDLLEEKFKNYENSKTVVVSIAFDYDFSYNANEESKIKFSNSKLLTDYYKKIKENTENNEYILYFFTKDGVYYVHDLDTTNDDMNNNLSIFKLFKNNLKTYEDGSVEVALEKIRKIGKENIDVLSFVKEMNSIINKHDNSFNISDNIVLLDNDSNKGYHLYSQSYFESLGMDILTKMGYGNASDNSNFVTKKTGDEGIDGVINQDKLDSKLSVKSVTLSKSEVVVKGSESALNKIAWIKALVDLDNSDLSAF